MMRYNMKYIVFTLSSIEYMSKKLSKYYILFYLFYTVTFFGNAVVHGYGYWCEKQHNLYQFPGVSPAG